MFKVIGKGVFSKEALIEKLQEWGVINSQLAIKQAETKGRALCGEIRILLFR
ncbi:hypothetical protein NV379_02410 [Paenibacillus sp. N1-5-1-14]|uniref:hypothetical protein n=1 Tax=Paenibacillus radicibacter TaxID=2972488 RepID=UPI002159890A|nr:hypothetical protein [Paenibacillus radicibacter]MCR8641500.1 hypothetical protein [Paenibacillus radicibacter]